MREGEGEGEGEGERGKKGGRERDRRERVAREANGYKALELLETESFISMNHSEEASLSGTARRFQPGRAFKFRAGGPT